MRKLLIFLFLTASFSVWSQQRNSHGVFWFRLALADTITENIKWELYLQRRTQNDYEKDLNIFKAPQFNSIWLWLHYSLNKNIKLSVSPFGYFESYILHTKPTDSALPPIKEFRWSTRFEHELKGKLFNYSNRYNLEYRWRDLQNNNHYLPNWRIRYMAKLEKPIKGILSETKPVTFTVYDEIFLQFGRAVRNNPNIFDQNRIYAGASYEVIKNVKLSLGYVYGIQERNSGREFDDINILWIVASFDNLLSQFHKHK